MNHARQITRLMAVFAVLGVAGQAFGQLAGTVVVTNLRQQSLERAQGMLNAKPDGIPAEQVNPFNPAAFNEVANSPTTTVTTGGTAGSEGGTPATGGGQPKGGQSGPRTDRDLLIAMATALKPGGSIKMGGSQILLMGVKKVKVGEKLNLTFEGAQYVVEVTAINPTNFTLRYNGEEYTRPIK
jgi:hypothetical protein